MRGKKQKKQKRRRWNRECTQMNANEAEEGNNNGDRGEKKMTGEELRKKINDTAEKVIGCAYAVSNALGVEFLEKVYENALAHELRKAGLSVEQQHAVIVHYDGVVVGTYDADLMVEGCLLVELKVAKAFDFTHMAQCINYLRATGKKMCLLLNFGQAHMDFKRVVLDL